MEQQEKDRTQIYEDTELVMQQERQQLQEKVSLDLQNLIWNIPAVCLKRCFRMNIRI